MIDDNEIIDVLNYEGIVVVPSINNPHGQIIQAGTEEIPSICPLSFRDIKIINSTSQLFRTGRLRFHEEQENEIYKALNIRDRDNVFSENDIRKLLLNPTKDNLKRVKEIKSLELITRIKQILFKMGMAGQDVSNKIVNVINKRNEELKQGKMSSDIELEDKTKENNKDVNLDLINTIAEMKKQIEQLTAQANSKVEKNIDDKTSSKEEKKNESESEKETKSTSKKSVGRPSKTAK